MAHGNRTQEPDDSQAPALPAPGDRAGDERRAVRSYSPAERMGLIWLAIRDGVSETSRRHGVPRTTLTQWLKDEDTNLGQVRTFLEEKTLAAFMEVERAIYHEVERRLPNMPNDELGMILRKLIDVRAGLLGTPGQDGQPAAAGAAAQATVTVRVEGQDGEAKIIDLGPPPEEP